MQQADIYKANLSSFYKNIQCYYSRYDEAEISMLIEIARERGLLVSGGSDFHGKNKNVSIGELNTAGKPVMVAIYL